MKTSMIVLALIGVTLIPPPPASATTLIPVDLGDLTARAETIFVGTVSDIRVERDADTISTYVTFSDLRFVKGSHPGRAIEVRLMGGSVGGESIHVFGMPRFVLGETNLIFLAGHRHDLCPIVGWGQGRFKIRWDAVSRQEVVVDDREVPVTEIRDREIVKARRVRDRRGSPGVPDTGETIVPEVPPLKTAVSVEHFISAIETQMGIGRRLRGSGP